MRMGAWYVVTWHDAFSSVDTDWKKPHKIDTSPLTIVSAGRLVKQTKKYVTLAQTFDTNSGKVSCLMSIPRGMMVKVRKVRP